MNVLAAMEETMELASKRWQERANLDNTAEYEHLKEMRDKMRVGRMSYGKLNRWLGWMQATICSWDCGVTLEDMKNINKNHAGDDEERRLLMAVAQAVLNDDPYVAAGLRARIQRLMETMGAKDAT